MPPPPQQEPTSSAWIADASLLGSAILWGINIPVVKFVTSQIDPFTFNAVRMVFAAITLGAVVALSNQSRTTTWKDFPWKRALVFSFFSGLLYSYLFMQGITRTTSANAALLLAAMPMWTAILSMIFLRERLKAITWIGLAITLLGTATIVSAGGKVSLEYQFLAGNLLILGAAIAWAAATVISRPLMKSIHPLHLALFSNIVALPFHWLIAAPYLSESLPSITIPSIIACVLYSGALSTGLAYATWNFGVMRLGGSHAAVYQNVVTLVAVLVSWLVLRETPVASQWIGGIIIILGLIAMRQGRG